MHLPAHFDAPLDGRWAVEYQVGAGAAGVVYRAFDLVERRVVALKLLVGALDLPDNPATREAELLRGIDHPGIIRIWEAGRLSELGLPYLAMEWLDGQDLASHQRNTPLGVREATALAVMVARSLGTAHASGLVHRDIKPANILLRRRMGSLDFVPELEFEPVLVDFGVADRAPHEREGRASAPEIAGTPAYMSPEQARGDHRVDHRTDLYSLGATLFELLVGRPPHQGPSPIATLARLATTPAPRASSLRPDLPPPLDDALDWMLRTDPADRPGSAREVEKALSAALEQEVGPAFTAEEGSSRLTVSATRLVTSLVAVGFGSTDRTAQQEAVADLSGRGALAVPLGREAVVAHLGVNEATGGEATTALSMAAQLAARGCAVGVASGRARLAPGSQGDVIHPVGEVVDRAAALARSATPGEVLSDATTSELGRGRYEFRIRGDGSAIVGGRLNSLRAGRSGGAPFVGREAELAQILAAHDRARADGCSLVIAVTGPPGIGKTRLQKEAVARISSRSNASRVVVRRSEAYSQRHVLGTAADVLRSIVELRKGASPEQVERALAERIGPQTMSELSADNQRVLSKLLGGDQLPEQTQEKGTRDALWLAMTDLVLRTLSNEPLLLVMEDLQWADSESIAWLDHLLGRSSRHPLVLLACVRPAFWSSDAARFSARDLLRIDLRPISHKAVRAIAESVLGARATEATLDEISAQAGGSPLFAEELARLAASGRDAPRAPTLEAAIQASLDALTPDCRDAVGRLSVLGQSCWASGLTALGAPRAEEAMRELAAHEVLNQQSSSRFPETTEFVFKHALVRDVAYEALDPDSRATLHALAAEWLADMGEDSATVARHFDLARAPERAALYWQRAARRALGANALGDALTMAEQALAFAQTPAESFERASILDAAWARTDPRAAERESAVAALERSAYDEATRALAAGARARYDDARGAGREVNERLLAASEAARRLGLDDELARCSATLASRAAFAGDFELAERQADQLLELAQRGVRDAKVDAYQARAIVRQARGQVSAALEARKNAARAAKEAGLKEREAMLTTNVGFSLSSVGARQESRDALERGLLLAESIGSAGATRHAQMNLLGWASLYGNDRRLESFLSETRAEADAAATGYWAAPDRANLGILFYRGVELLRANQEQQRSRARVLLRMAATNYRNLGHRDLLPVGLGMWAEAERVCGDLAAAAEVGGEAAALLLSGAPSLLNEAPVFLSLYKTKVALGDEVGAVDTLAASIRPLQRRLNGLAPSPYARMFLTELPHNAELVAAADAEGLLPDSIHRLLSRHDEG
jgi:hypothetical protein